MRSRPLHRVFMLVSLALLTLVAGCGIATPPAPTTSVATATPPTLAASVSLPPARSVPAATQAPPPPTPIQASAAPTATPVPPPVPSAWHADDFLYIPESVSPDQPATVLVTLHGMGGEGRGFCRGLLKEADRNGWIVLAPTLKYRENWHDPTSVVEDDMATLARVASLLDELPTRTGLSTRPKVLLLGFSRGAQIAHRFALAYPERVNAAAVMAAGSYTLPLRETNVAGETRPLPLPFGVANLSPRLGKRVDEAAWRKVRFWIAVGENDNRPGDAPAAWTPYIGATRVERARAFKASLDSLGIPATLATFPGVDHTMAPEMSAAASAFLRDATAAR